MQFPTMAERAITEWRSATKTTSFNTVAKRYSAFQDHDRTSIEWIFDDDSIVRITGRGKAFKIEARLP